jgi:hypothetical protein
MVHSTSLLDPDDRFVECAIRSLRSRYFTVVTLLWCNAVGDTEISDSMIVCRRKRCLIESKQRNDAAEGKRTKHIKDAARPVSLILKTD